MIPDIDIEAHWGLSVLNIEPFVPVGKIPLDREPVWLVNEFFLLKSDDPTLFEAREYERRLRLLLDIQNIPVLIPQKNKTVKQGGRIYRLFDYAPQRHPEKIDYQEELTKAEKIGTTLAKISFFKGKVLRREFF